MQCGIQNSLNSDTFWEIQLLQGMASQNPKNTVQKKH